MKAKNTLFRKAKATNLGHIPPTPAPLMRNTKGLCLFLRNGIFVKEESWVCLTKIEVESVDLLLFDSLSDSILYDYCAEKYCIDFLPIGFLNDRNSSLSIKI